jgi:sporulation protein YlmC with PRC-barrel domain
MQISDELFRGRTVIAADGQSIGEVAALFLDTSSWTIISVQIKLSKTAAEQLGVERSLLRAATIDLPVRMVQSVGDTVLLSVPTAGLRETANQHEEKS